MTGDDDDSILSAVKLDDVVGHLLYPGRGRRGKDILFQILPGELPPQKSLSLGMAFAAYPARPHGNKFTSVSERAIAIELRKRLGGLGLQLCLE